MGIISTDKTYDIFFSYGHDDNVVSDYCVRHFHDALKEKLAPLLRVRRSRFAILNGKIEKADPKFFWDETAFPAQGDLSEETYRAIKSSEFLFIFVGEAYLRSDWCQKELGYFLKAQGDDPLQVVHRLFIIVLSKEAEKADWDSVLEAGGRPIFEKLYDDENQLFARTSDEYAKIVRRVAETLVQRIAEAFEQRDNKIDPEQPGPTGRDDVDIDLPGPRADPNASGRQDVTVGVVTHDLLAVRQALVDRLTACNIGVHELDEAELRDADPDTPDALPTINSKLECSRAFIQPYSFAKVSLPAYKAGGHLQLQQDLLPKEMQRVWWRVAGEGAVDLGTTGAEDRQKHLMYLQQLASQANTLEEVRQIIEGRSVPVTETGRILVESSVEDGEISEKLKDRLETLWHEIAEGTPIEWDPIPWRQLEDTGEAAIEAAKGFIVIYGHKDYQALVAQLRKFRQLTDSLSFKRKRRFDIVMAVAVVPPQPWAGPVGSWNCFPFAAEMNDTLEERALPFLKKVREVVQSRGAAGRNSL